MKYLILVYSAFCIFLGGCIAESACFSDDDCTSPEFCDLDSGKCTVECSDDSDCEGINYICRDNICVLSASGDGDEEVELLQCPDEMVPVENLFCIDIYEASRADAAETFPGTDNDSPPQSVPGVMPWLGISQADAQAACEKAGKRLCTPDEWYQSCRGPDGTTYSYGASYNPATCNGIDTFCDGGAVTGCGNEEAYSHTYNFKLTPTGQFSGCTNEYGVLDINGNVWEWDSDPSGRGRGGAYNCSDSELLHRCDFLKVDAGPNPSSNIGFRCCK